MVFYHRDLQVNKYIAIFIRSYEDFTAMECIEEERPRKKLALRQFNTSRLKEEFHIVCSIGDGQFGSVHKCVNRLDGCTYAIKKSKVPVAGSVFEYVQAQMS